MTEPTAWQVAEGIRERARSDFIAVCQFALVLNGAILGGLLGMVLR